MIKSAAHFLKTHRGGYNFNPRNFQRVNPLLLSSRINQKWRKNCMVVHEGLLNLELHVLPDLEKLALRNNLNLYLVRFLGDQGWIQEDVSMVLAFDYGIQSLKPLQRGDHCMEKSSEFWRGFDIFKDAKEGVDEPNNAQFEDNEDLSRIFLVEPQESPELSQLNHVARKIAKIKYRV